jgi:hypothetical protein
VPGALLIKQRSGAGQRAARPRLPADLPRSLLRRLSPPALRGFFRIRASGRSRPARRRAGVGRPTVNHLQAEDPAEDAEPGQANARVLGGRHRGSLHVIWPDDKFADEWMTRPKPGGLFHGMTPLHSSCATGYPASAMSARWSMRSWWGTGTGLFAL